jgi:hypothetical protein
LEEADAFFAVVICLLCQPSPVSAHKQPVTAPQREE